MTMLSNNQISRYHDQGYLVLNDAISAADIERLKTAAIDIVDQFDIDKHRSVFSTSDRDSGRDDYFFNSAENVHCFRRHWRTSRPVTLPRFMQPKQTTEKSSSLCANSLASQSLISMHPLHRFEMLWTKLR